MMKLNLVFADSFNTLQAVFLFLSLKMLKKTQNEMGKVLEKMRKTKERAKEFHREFKPDLKDEIQFLRQDNNKMMLEINKLKKELEKIKRNKHRNNTYE